MPANKKPKRDVGSHKFSRAMPKTTAYRSGHMVRCRKVGAKNYNIGGKKSGKSKKSVVVAVMVYANGSAAIKAKAG